MKLLKADKSTPRWIVLLVDIILVILSVIGAYLLRFNFQIPETESVYIPTAIVAVLFVRLIGFYIFKTPFSIIRYSSTSDLLKVFNAVSTGSVVLLILNLLYYSFYGKQFLIPNSVIIIEGILTLILMGGIRIAIRIIYTESLKWDKEKRNVVIIGADATALMTKRALDRVEDINYSISAFVDLNGEKVGKRLESKIIYGKEDLNSLLDSNEVKEVIFTVDNIDPIQKEELVNLCLEHNVETKTIPPVSQWINGEFSSKQLKNIKIEDLLGRKPIVLNPDSIAKELDRKTILVTGAAGSIGSGMVNQIAKFNPGKIIMLEQAESPIYEVELDFIQKYGRNLAEVVMGDIRDYDRMKNVFETFKPQVVFHAAAYKHVPLMEENPSEAVATNVQGSKNIADLCDLYGVEKMVMISTDKAVNPTNVMGCTKRIAEIYCQAKNKHSQTQFITTRFGNVLGSNGSVIPLFRKQLEKGGPLTVTHPEITRYFMTIPEACQLVLEAGAMGKGGEIFIFDMGKSVKIVDLAKKMIQLAGLREGIDIEINFSGLRPGEKLYEELLANEENTQKTHHPKILIGKVRENDLNEVESGISELIDIRENQDNFEIVKRMKTLVPEFKSQNSIYSKLD